MNTDTKWNITGSLIKKVDLKESDIFCTEGRTLYIPVRYIFLFGPLYSNERRPSFVGIQNLRTFESSVLVFRYQTFRDAMDICEEMGERGSFLKKFETFEEYDIFHENAKKSKAIDSYCEHGGRFIF